MLQYFSPLRYPGGKAKLYRFLSFMIKHNRPIDTYIEPYAGGAGAALSLLFNKEVKNVILNDLDPFIYKFWNAILHNNRLFQGRIINTPITIEEYHKFKSIYEIKSIRNNTSDFQQGFAAFFLNRCNRSGIISGGPIGGYDQSGKWKIDARFNKKDLIRRLELIYDYRTNIDIYNYDAITFLTDILPNLDINPETSLIYLDPPYYLQGKELYNKYYEQKDHVKLKEFLKNELKMKWILSYDDNVEIHKLYDGIRKNGIVFNHFANKAKVGKELLIFSDSCNVPY